MNSLKQFPLLLLIIGALVFSCKNQSKEKTEDERLQIDTTLTTIRPTETGNDSTENVSVEVGIKTFKENDKWGYDILVDGKLYIHQPTIPSVPGNDGFKSEADARTAGEFVAYKIKHHIMPPSVTPEELDSMGLWKK